MENVHVIFIFLYQNFDKIIASNSNIKERQRETFETNPYKYT